MFFTAVGCRRKHSSPFSSLVWVTYCLPVIVLHTSLTIPLVAVALPLLDLLPLQLLETRNMPDREDRRFRWEEKLCVLSNAPK